MIRCLFPFTVIILIISQKSNAQESILNKHTFALGMGINKNLIKDEFQSPFTYKGSNLSLTANYTRERLKGLYDIGAIYSHGKVKSAVSVPARFTFVKLHANYLFKLNDTQKKLSFYAGGGIQSFSLISNYNPEISNSTYYATAALSLAAVGKITYHINKNNSLSLSVNLPLAGIVYRPDYPVNGKTLTGPYFIGKNPWIDITLEYCHRITPKMSFFVAFQTNYFSFEEPRRISFMQKSVHVGLKLNR